MSVMDELKNVVTTGRELLATVSGKMKEIDKKVDQTANDIGKVLTANRVVTYYVDAENGSDSNVGTQSSPLKTLPRAMSQAPSGSALTIYLAPGKYVTTSGFTCYAAQISISAAEQHGEGPTGMSDEWNAEDQVPYIELNHLISLRVAGSIIFGRWLAGVKVRVNGEGGFYCYAACNVTFDRSVLVIDSVNAMFGGGVSGQSGDTFQRYSPTKLSLRVSRVNMIKGKIARAPIMVSTSNATGFSAVDEIIMDASAGSVLSTLKITR